MIPKQFEITLLRYNKETDTWIAHVREPILRLRKEDSSYVDRTESGTSLTPDGAIRAAVQKFIDQPTSEDLIWRR